MKLVQQEQNVMVVISLIVNKGIFNVSSYIKKSFLFNFCIEEECVDTHL